MAVTQPLSFTEENYLKAIAEAQFLEPFLPGKSYFKLVMTILWGQFIYSGYVIYFGLRVLFSHQYEWKGRRVPF